MRLLLMDWKYYHLLTVFAANEWDLTAVQEDLKKPFPDSRVGLRLLKLDPVRVLLNELHHSVFGHPRVNRPTLPGSIPLLVFYRRCIPIGILQFWLYLQPLFLDFGGEFNL